MKFYKYILPFILIALLGSCENMDQEMSDDELIQAIISSENRISVTKNDLPKTATRFLENCNAVSRKLQRSFWKTATQFLENCNAVFQKLHRSF